MATLEQKLTGEESRLVKEVVQRRLTSEQGVALSGSIETAEVVKPLLDALLAEFSEFGLQADDEPNDYGLKIETIIDKLNAANLR